MSTLTSVGTSNITAYLNQMVFDGAPQDLEREQAVSTALANKNSSTLC